MEWRADDPGSSACPPERRDKRPLADGEMPSAKSEGGEGLRTFLRLNEATALARADEIDALRRRGAELPPYAGIPISINDLFDAQGEVTTAGSVVLKRAAPAKTDAPAVTGCAPRASSLSAAPI